jgi:hypothetical protein
VAWSFSNSTGEAHAEFVVGPVDQTVVETASASTGRL